MSQPVRGLVHETAVGSSTEWYTPPAVFEVLGLHFDLDPAAPPGGVPWIPASRHYSASDNGLWQPWTGRVWLNPPYGRAIPQWLDKLAAHGNGIALTFARTDTRWFHRFAPMADLVVFGFDRLHFIRPDGTSARGPAGSLFLAFGKDNAEALGTAGLGTSMRTTSDTFAQQPPATDNTLTLRVRGC